MQKLGMVEYRKLMEEVDQMTNEPLDVMALVNKRIEELRERLEAEEKEKQKRERRQTQSINCQSWSFVYDHNDN